MDLSGFPRIEVQLHAPNHFKAPKLRVHAGTAGTAKSAAENHALQRTRLEFVQLHAPNLHFKALKLFERRPCAQCLKLSSGFPRIEVQLHAPKHFEAPKLD